MKTSMGNELRRYIGETRFYAMRIGHVVETMGGTFMLYRHRDEISEPDAPDEVVVVMESYLGQVRSSRSLIGGYYIKTDDGKGEWFMPQAMFEALFLTPEQRSE